MVFEKLEYTYIAGLLFFYIFAALF